MSLSDARAEASPSLPPYPWLFGPRTDMLTFAGSAIVAVSVVIGAQTVGRLNSDTPEWLWVTSVLLLDVAHVYATGFRVYFDVQELKCRPWLYVLTPVLTFGVACAVWSESHAGFWRVLAYLAVFHFVRQQYGGVILYRRRGNEQDSVGYWLDTLTIYAATVFPLLWWHCHLPRKFWWFLPGDFFALPVRVASVLEPVYWLILIGWCIYRGRGYLQRAQGTPAIVSPGRDVVIISTVVCWYLGIVALNSDLAFTVTNVIIHGVPYIVLVYWFQRRRGDGRGLRRSRLAIFLGAIWFLAYAEELLWDNGLWHERPWLFGRMWQLSGAQDWLVPLLVVPQVTHYVLDGFIWKRRVRGDFAVES